MMKRKLILSTLLAGAALFVAPFHAEAIDQHREIQREISSIESELTRARNPERRMELVRELHNNREQLSIVQREQAEAQRRELRAPSSDPIIERQARILEESQEFLPEEIAHLRQRNLMERVTTDAIETKRGYDKEFEQKVVTINTQIDQMRTQIKKLEEHRRTLIKEYHNAIADIREKKNIPVQPIPTPTKIIKKDDVPVMRDITADKIRNNRGYVGSIPTSAGDQPRLGGGVRMHMGQDIQQH